jgi:hypothetical protein
MGYELGGSGPAGMKTVAVAPVINKTDEPAIELEVTHALRQRLQFDGRMKLTRSEHEADAVIEVTLTDYSLTPVAYRSDQRTTPELYRIRITGNAQMKDPAAGTVISESETYGESVFEFTSDLTSSRRNALPEAAREIAKLMIDDLIETW